MKLIPALTTGSCLAFLAASAPAAVINHSVGTAAQSTQLGRYGAGRALDATVNFTHTLNSDTNPTWQVLLHTTWSFGNVETFNRGASVGSLSCWPSRFRDITIQIVNFAGDVSSDFTGGTVTFSSPLLNSEKVIGGGVASGGAVSLTANPGGAVGNMIRIIRTRDDELSGSGGAGNADEASVLSMDLVIADGTVPELSFALLGILGLSLLGLRRRRA